MDPVTSPDAPSATLTFSGLPAEILPDGFSATGWALRIGGIEQSHVDLADPRTVRHEYLRRVANVLDTAAAPGEPLSVLHLGGGALTLVRYVQATRPGSEQTVVEIEPELIDLVTGALPLPEGTRMRALIGDAEEQLALLAEADARFDAIVLDVFNGSDSPPHLARERFYARCLERLTERGILLVNIGDDDGLRFFADQVREVRGAAAQARMAGPWTLTDSVVAGILEEGNLVLALGPGVEAGDLDSRRETWLEAGPHPVAVLDPAQTEVLLRRIPEDDLEADEES